MCICLLKHLMVCRFLMEGGWDLQIGNPENARLAFYARSWWTKVVRARPTRGPGEERANVLGSLPIERFKHHYSVTVC